jgi:hypothetical protein
MNNKFSAFWLFYVLGGIYWAISGNASEGTLMCVFYAVFAGTVWGLVPQISGSEALSWKHLLPPFLLVTMMMFASRLKLVMSTDVVLITAMSLIHFRASILAFARLPKPTRLFSWIQLGSFFIGMAYVFQKNILPIQISRTLFLVIIAVFSVISLGLLFYAKRKFHEPRTSETISP